MELMELKRSDLAPPKQNYFPAAVAVEQSRAVAEAQAAMLVAQTRRRDELMAYDKIMAACQRISMADSAMYAYKRGGTLVEGPSIRLAEVLARSWGNITYGLRELSRSDGESEVEAFAWDLETNTRVTRQFVVRHVRDKRGGGVALTEERDIYELAANMGQRRVRACLLELIPADIVEAAVSKCKKTIADGGGVPLEDRVRAMVVSFGGLGVSKDMIEAWLQHSVNAIVPAQLVKLSQIYQSIKTGVASREEFFNLKAGSGSGLEGLNERFSKNEQQSVPADQPPSPVETNPDPVPAQSPEPVKKTAQKKKAAPPQTVAEPVEDVSNAGNTASDTATIPGTNTAGDPGVVSKLVAELDAMGTWSEVMYWETSRANTFKALNAADRGRVMAYSTFILHRLQVDECKTADGVNEWADLKMKGIKVQFEKHCPAEAERYFGYLQQHCLDKIAALRAADPSNETPAVPDEPSEYAEPLPGKDPARSKQFNAFMAQIDEKSNSLTLNRWAMATVNARMALAEEEQEMLNEKLIGRLAELEMGESSTK